MFSLGHGASPFAFARALGPGTGHDELLLHMQQKIALVETPVHGEGGSFGFDVKQEQNCATRLYGTMFRKPAFINPR